MGACIDGEIRSVTKNHTLEMDNKFAVYEIALCVVLVSIICP